ncbi:phage holin family protein [Chlorogloeopsis sp. ULAP01]|uniref:phage holin family protein n=1 Tax=Chlorogloeopsis sp. ULAP01 TaxID=3056483 RepID=UPI0025AB3997|nr:phage holin family protein [Chlorogloeopsis sp. ULAP01]MDM9385616.1 phage holin family protein [Chlorogloeopsis sp. ULAP01]
MKNFLLTWLGTAVALLITAHILQTFNIGFKVDNFGTALVAAIVIGIVNAFIRPILKILAFPITLLTFGLFTFIINGLTLWLASYLTPTYGFVIAGPIAALLGSIVLSIISSTINYFLRAVE